MERVLLDTCAFIWLLQDDEKLGDEARSFIEDAGIKKLLSPVSYWEIATKSTTPRFKLKGEDILPQADYKRAINEALETYGIEVLPFTLDHTEHLYSLKYETDHKDPFDRIIVAKAIIERATLISSDGKLYYYGFTESYPNVWTQPSFGGG